MNVSAQVNVKVKLFVTFDINLDKLKIFKGFTSTKEEKNTNIFSSTLSQINGYFKLKPTSQVCLEYQEALLLDSKHANFVEVIFHFFPF